MQNVHITIGTDGDVKVEVNGVAGSGCEALTKEIEGALGTTTSDTKTGEYYQQGQQGAYAGY